MHNNIFFRLYILVARLLNKLGADLLGSIIQKVNKTLDVVRDSFTYAEQMGAIFKFLVDQTQTPNSKVYVDDLHFFRQTALQLSMNYAFCPQKNLFAPNYLLD